ncbi:cytochrome c oxidase subunit IV [Brucella endophytica]|uniref:Cytochrome c oxidase subunit IV n=1 Tax=Brucella endophytica TaxID=1963359 RepID=A0A916WGJ7_9HYPH|nr:aa3-type cytochrome c oxidase subunit IV [Brucella endophytica]GGA98825.1 cytochrome c oxidase subunit IV [Brucella endophytica]
MAKHSNTGPAELGAPMDYAEHEKTYGGFLAVCKWGTVAVVAILAAMAFGFFVGGWFSATILFVLICAAAWFLL